MYKKIIIVFLCLFLMISLSACVSYDNTLKKGTVYKKSFTQESTDFLIFKDMEITTYLIYYEKQNFDDTYSYAYQDVTVDEFYSYNLGDEYTRKDE